MVIAAEYTTATLVAWVLIGLAVGFVAGWLLRPWLVRDRLRDEYEARLTARDEQLDTAEAQLVETSAGLATATADLETAQADMVRLEAELATVKASAAELERALETQGLEKDAEIERLQTDAGKVAGLEARIAELEAAPPAVGAAQADVARLETELAEAGASITSLQSQLEACRAAVAASEQTIAELESATAAAAPTSPVSEPANVEAPAPDKETATQKVVEIAARTRGEATRVDDELQRIHGIGPKIAGLLREMDITSFRQIARFEADDIAYVAAALEAFPDRIERDDWMSSAARLHEEKYGEPV